MDWRLQSPTWARLIYKAWEPTDEEVHTEEASGAILRFSLSHLGHLDYRVWDWTNNLSALFSDSNDDRQTSQRTSRCSQRWRSCRGVEEERIRQEQEQDGGLGGDTADGLCLLSGEISAVR